MRKLLSMLVIFLLLFTYALPAYAVDLDDGSEGSTDEVETVADETPPSISVNPSGQEFTDSLLIEISSDEENTSIYYTLDGSAPTTESLVYENPITIEETTTLKTFGVDSANNNSAVITEEYTLEVPPAEPEPVEENNEESEVDETAPIVSANPVGQNFTESLTIELLSNEENTSIYYTLDGEEPTTDSSLYNEPFIIEASTTVKAFGVDNADNASAVMTEDYTLEVPPAEPEATEESEVDSTAPIISVDPVSQNFTESLTIELLSNEENTSIYYTLDGEDPSTNSTLYTEPFIIEASTTVKAFGVDGSDNASETVAEEYTLEVPPIETEVDEVKINTINEIPSITALNTFEITGPYDYNTLYFQDGDSNIYEYYLDTQEIDLVVDDPMPYFDIASQNGELYGVRNNSESTDPDYQIINITDGESLAFSPTAIDIFTLAENNGLFYYQSGDTLFATDLTDEYVVKTGLPTVGPRADCTAYNGSIFYTSSNNHLIEVKVNSNTYTDHGDLNINAINGLTIGHDHLQVSYDFPTSNIDFINNGYTLDGNNPYTHTTNITGMAKGNYATLPVAENVQITGNPVLGETLTGEYNYIGTTEGNSLLQWYSNGSEIPGATGDTFYLDNQYYGKDITFSVTPVSTEIPTTGEKVTSTPVTVGIDPNIWIYTDYDYELYIDGNLIEPLPEINNSITIEKTLLFPTFPPMHKNPVDVNYIHYDELDDPEDILIAVKTLPHNHDRSDVDSQCIKFHPGIKVVYKTPNGDYIVTDTEWKVFPSIPDDFFENMISDNNGRPHYPVPMEQNGIMWYEEDYLNYEMGWNNAIEVEKARHWPNDDGYPGFPSGNSGNWIWSNIFMLDLFSENDLEMNCLAPPYQWPYYFRNQLESGHRVEFDPNNGEDEWDVFVPTGDTIDPPDPSPSKVGYRFLYWEKWNGELDNGRGLSSSSFTPYVFKEPVTEDLFLKAVWEKVVTQHEYDIYTIADTDSPNYPYTFGLQQSYSNKDLVVLAQLRRQQPELIRALDMPLQPDIYNLRNDITGGASRSEVKNGTYTTLSDTFEVRMEDSDQGVVNMLYPFNYFASDKGILYDASDDPIGYLTTEVIDYNDDSGEPNVYDPEWHLIEFDRSFDDPIVIAQFSSYTGKDYSHLRLKEITSDSVKVFIEEWDEDRETNHHNHELISIMVIEAGVHTLNDGTVIEATRDMGWMDYKYYQFSQNYDNPVVFSQSQDYNNPEQVWMGQKYINNSSVYLKMLRENNIVTPALAPESPIVLGENIGYIVIGELSEETPTVDIEPDSTLFNSEIEITMNSNNPSNTIYYTLDGTDPTPLSSTYSGPITLTEDTTVKAIAKDISGNLSDIVTEDYNLYVLNGTLSVDSTLVYEGDEVIASLDLYDQDSNPIIGQSVKIYDDGTGKIAPESNTYPGRYTATFTPDIGINEFTAKVSGFTEVEFNTVEVKVVNIIETLEHGRSDTGTTSLDPDNTPYNDLALMAQLTTLVPEMGMLRSDIIERELIGAMNGEPIVNYREDNFYSGVENSYYLPALARVEDPGYPLNYLASETGVIKDDSGKIIGVVGHEIIPTYTNGPVKSRKGFHKVDFHETIDNPVVLAHLGSYHGLSDIHARVVGIHGDAEEFSAGTVSSATSFGVILEPNNYMNTSSALEEEPSSFEVISYLVIEEGVHQVGGVIVEATKLTDFYSSATHEFSDHYHMPSVFSQTQTYDNHVPRWMREDNITSNTVDLTLQRAPYEYDEPVYEGSEATRIIQEYPEEVAVVLVADNLAHEVIFTNTGSSSFDPQMVEHNTTATNPGTPSRSGYSFTGWTLEGLSFNIATDLVLDDIELVATWSSTGGGGGGGTTTTTTATINAVNDTLLTSENTPVSVSTAELMANDTDADDFESVQNPINGSVTLSGNTVTFTPATDFVGTAYFSYTISDGGDEDNGLVIVTVEELVEINPFETPLGGDPNALILINPEETPLGVIDYSLPYVLGYPDRSFKPNREITRGEMAAIFARILFLDTSNPGDPIYTDVKPDDWYYKYVQTVSRMGIFGGYEGSEFKPNRPISHAEIAAAFTEYWDLKGIEISDAGGNYSDVEGHWAEDAINRFFNAGISVGFMDGTFKPNAFTTRAELVVMVNRSLNRPDLIDDEPTFPDVDPNFWGFGAIEAACKRHQGQSAFKE